MSAASAPFHSILSQEKIPAISFTTPPPKCALHAECSEVMGLVFALQWPCDLLECKTGAEM